MFMENLFDRGSLEESAIRAAGLEQQILNLIQLRAGQPTAPRRRKSQLWPVDDRMREQSFHRFFQYALTCSSANLDARWNAHGPLHQNMIEEWHTAFDRRRHAHVVLLHQEFDQISFDIGVKQALQNFARRLFPVLQNVL